MNSRLLLMAACVALPLLVGCSPTSARVGISPPPALLVKVYEAPMTVRRDRGANARSGITIPPNLVEGNSKFFGLSLNVPGIPGAGAASVGWGDGSIDAALKNGNLKEIVYADYKEISFINGVFTYIKIKAYGESASAE
ncbi:MAG: hypothetical protein ABI579_02635 [Candidatus Sumerlaeota bacterium]